MESLSVLFIINIISCYIFDIRTKKIILAIIPASIVLKLFRSNRLMMFCKKGVFKSFAKFTGKYLYWILFLIKLQPFKPARLSKRNSNSGVFLTNFANFLKNTHFEEHLGTIACFWLFLFWSIFSLNVLIKLSMERTQNTHLPVHLLPLVQEITKTVTMLPSRPYKQSQSQKMLYKIYILKTLEKIWNSTSAVALSS